MNIDRDLYLAKLKSKKIIKWLKLFEEGVLIISLEEFLLNTSSLDL